MCPLLVLNARITVRWYFEGGDVSFKRLEAQRQIAVDVVEVKWLSVIRSRPRVHTRIGRWPPSLS